MCWKDGSRRGRWICRSIALPAVIGTTYGVAHRATRDNSAALELTEEKTSYQSLAGIAIVIRWGPYVENTRDVIIN